MKRKVLAALFTGMLITSTVLPSFSIYAEEAVDEAAEEVTEVAAEVSAEDGGELAVAEEAEAVAEEGAEVAADDSGELIVEEAEAVAEEVETAEMAGTITGITLESGNSAFVYVPQGEGIDVGHNATWKPIILVYNSEALDEESALQLAVEGGFAEIAAEEQCVITFVNPADEAGWNEADKKSLLAAVGSTEFENAAYSDGTLKSYDPTTGQNEDGKLPGYTERVYVFADGAGADFVSENILCGQEDTVHFMDCFYKPASAFLSNVEKAPAELSSKLESTEMPVYLVNASADAEAFFKEADQEAHFVSAASDTTDGFDAEQVKTAWNDLVGNVRRCYDVVIDIPDYETDFEVVNNVFTASTGSELEYYLYIPNDVAAQEEGTAPIVVGMHGNDNSALTMATICEWPTLAKDNGFIYMGLNHCESMTDDEIMEAIESVVAEYPVIDTSRAYMTGFSNGSIHTWNIISNEKYKDFFAAAAPMNACVARAEYREPGSEEIELASGSVMPVIYFGATSSHILEMPNQPWSMMDLGDVTVILSYIFERNGAVEYANDPEAGFWGIKGDSEEELTSKYYQNEDNKLVKDIVSSYTSEDGNVYTELVAVTSIHEYEDLNAETAWNFMSKFSRGEDGSIIVG